MPLTCTESRFIRTFKNKGA
ncbi:unnamed protein product, partial [Allacma fusca]